GVDTFGLSAPPLGTNGGALRAAFRFSAPPLRKNCGALRAALTLAVPPATPIDPSPANVVPALRSWVAPENARTAPAATLKAPVWVPPPARLRVPLCTSTVPLLLKAMGLLLPMVVTPVVAVLRKVPAVSQRGPRRADPYQGA